MKSPGHAKAWALAAVVSLAVTAGVVTHRVVADRRAMANIDDMRDAVAAPIPVPIAAGRTMPSPWFKPAGASSSADDALLSSRRRRAAKHAAKKTKKRAKTQ